MTGAEADRGRASAAVLADLPVASWGPLLRAVRRAAERMDRSALPVALRPFAGWRPERLAGEQPRRAIAAALGEDPRLREAVGRALDDPPLWEAAESTDVGRLVSEHGAAVAVAALAARGRWDDLAVVAAASAQEAAARGQAAAEAARRQEVTADAVTRRRLTEELATARADRDTYRRRAEALEQAQRRTEEERRRLTERLEEVEARAADLSRALAEDRRRAARAQERTQRRLVDAEERARIDAGRVTRVAQELEALVADLRAAVTPAATDAEPATDTEPAPPPAPQPGDAAEPGRGGGSGDTALRLVREQLVAVAGRPCRLPPGVGPDDPLGVEALLRVPGVMAVLDGYNLTKDARGRPLAALAEQRAWLLSLAGGVAARFDRRIVVVFDGTDDLPGLARAPRGVRLAFSVGEENADARIVAIVGETGDDQPVLVVSSDREVREDCTALGANVTSSRAFLRTAGA